MSYGTINMLGQYSEIGNAKQIVKSLYWKINNVNNDIKFLNKMRCVKCNTEVLFEIKHFNCDTISNSKIDKIIELIFTFYIKDDNTNKGTKLTLYTKKNKDNTLNCECMKFTSIKNNDTYKGTDYYKIVLNKIIYLTNENKIDEIDKNVQWEAVIKLTYEEHN